MRLPDRITRLSDNQEYRAYVYTQRQTAPAVEWEDQHLYFSLDTAVLALVKPGEWSTNESVTWRGVQYEISHIGIRRRRGKTHHMTLTLERPNA